MMSPNIGYAWGRILERVMQQRHGGAFMVMPTDEPTNFIDCPFRLQHSDLGRHLRGFLLASYQIELKQPFAERRYQEELERLHTQLQAVAGLANVDGCVVLRRDLQVIGFGGRILVSDDDTRGSSLPFRGPHGEDKPDVGGNRHQSALRLCTVVPNSLAFVVSQDGDLTVFDSTDREVRQSPPLVAEPWLS